MTTHGGSKLSLSARADWSGGGTCKLECQYTLIKIL